MNPRALKIALAALLAVLVLVVVVQNTEVVNVQLLLWEFTMSRVILILLCTGAGFIVGYVTARVRTSSARKPSGGTGAS